MRRAFVSALCLAATAAAAVRPASAGDAKPGDGRVVEQCRKSVAWLVAFRGGNESRATGFVIALPGSSKKAILTAGHIFHNGMTLSARLPGMSKAVPCDLIAVSEKHDLMIVQPQAEIDVPALPLLTERDPQPRLEDKVFTIGCPGGLELTHYWGTINADPITAMALGKIVAPPNANGRMTPFGDATLIRHSAFSTPGMSGGPLLDNRGRVLGVHIGTLPKASNTSFGVHVKHVKDLDLRAAPRKFEGGPVLDSKIGHVLAVENGAERPVMLQIDGQDIDARCSHYGYVEGDADTVIRRYVQDGEKFRKIFGEKRLQALMDDVPIAHITNTALGFRALVPKGYRYEVGRNQLNNGVFVTFWGPDDQVQEEFNKITILAFVDTLGYPNSVRAAEEDIASGKFPLPEKLPKDASTRLLWRNVLVDRKQINHAANLFVENVLKLQLRDEDGKVMGDPKRPLFTLPRPDESFDLSSYWRRYNYDSVNGITAHSVRYAVRSNVVVIAHYQFFKRDRDNFLAGRGEFSRRFLERMLISYTVSTY